MAAVRGRGARGHTGGIYLLLYLRKIHQMVMSAMLKKLSGFARNRRATAMLLVLPAALTAMPAAAQKAEKSAVDHYYEPLPQETGTAGLKLILRRLQTKGPP